MFYFTGQKDKKSVLVLFNVDCQQFNKTNTDDVVRLIGLEPTQLALLDPKSSASTNFATGACGGVCSSFRFFAGAKVVIFFITHQQITIFLIFFQKMWHQRNYNPYRSLGFMAKHNCYGIKKTYKNYPSSPNDRFGFKAV